MNDFHLTANQLERYIQKPSSQFLIEDIINYVFEKEIEMINFRYVADDEKLKTLNFVVTGRPELENLLKYGERVNGNSVFSYNLEQHPDLYIIPNFSTAFLNPFTEIPTLDLLCSFFTWEGIPLDSSPENILLKATVLFQKESEYEIKMFGELEYYVISKIDENYHTDEGNYQSSEPFSKFEKIRTEALKTIAQCGGKIRFGHAEHGSFTINSKYYEQHEIEFLPTTPIEAIQQLVISKWILRMLGKKHMVDVSFSPKVVMDKPGNGLHFHFILERNGINILGEGREYRKSALQMIAGVLNHAKSLSAFGNTLPVSYLRLANSQYAPRFICWGPSNRSALIRIPKINMKAFYENTEQNENNEYEPLYPYNQSIEYRGSDASAYLNFFVAAFMIACIDGLNNEDYLNDIKKFLVTENLYKDDTEKVKSKLGQLPVSCKMSSDILKKEQFLFTRKYPVFPDKVIQFVINKLNSYNIQWSLNNEGNQKEEINNMIQHFMHYR